MAYTRRSSSRTAKRNSALSTPKSSGSGKFKALASKLKDKTKGSSAKNKAALSNTFSKVAKPAAKTTKKSASSMDKKSVGSMAKKAVSSMAKKAGGKDVKKAVGAAAKKATGSTTKKAIGSMVNKFASKFKK